MTAMVSALQAAAGDEACMHGRRGMHGRCQADGLNHDECLRQAFVPSDGIKRHRAPRKHDKTLQATTV